MDGEFLQGSRINLGFGKSLATTCVWIDGVAESVSEKYLASHFNQFGSVTHCVIDRSREHALVFFQQVQHYINFIDNILRYLLFYKKCIYK
jgi:S-adenosylmethionine synthetase